MSFRLNIDAAKLRELVTKLTQMKDVNWRELHREVGMTVLANVAERFRTQTDPEGTAWVDKQKGGGMLLQDSGRLKSSMRQQANEDGVMVGSGVKYAARHNFGYPAGGTPARQFAGMGSDLRREIAESLLDFMEDEI